MYRRSVIVKGFLEKTTNLDQEIVIKIFGVVNPNRMDSSATKKFECYLLDTDGFTAL